MNVVFTGKDNPNIGLVNIISYDLMAKKIKEIQKVGYKVVISVSSVPYDQKQPPWGGGEERMLSTKY